MGTAIYKPEGVDGETEALQVQFTVPTPKEFERRDDTENSIDSKFRQRPVTFGAYYDNHNNEMIPELVEATPPEDKTKEDKWIHRLQKLIAKADPRMQILSTVSACLLTHALINHQPHVDLQIITMLLVTLCGATFPHLITAVGCGVYAGSVSSETIPSYAWVVLLGFITALIWQLVSSNRWILGFSGRLGATAFFSMNLTGLIVFGVDRTVSFDRYGSFDSVQWSLEEAFVSLLACIFLSCSAGYFRLIANVPVNPVLVPSAWALFCMLLTSCTDYQFVPSILGGYAVGAYVAMVSETRLSRTWQFAIVGCIAGMWNVLFQPLFLGFGGKGGFTAMVGYSTYLSIQLSRRRIVAARRRRVVDQNMLPK